MAWRQIQGITILVNLNEPLELPDRVLAVDYENGDWEYSWATVNRWKDGNGQIVTMAKTDQEGEFMYYGEVTGYAGTVYCSVVVGFDKPNPESEFPTHYKDVTDDSKPDEWGVPKQEVRTADMDGVSDYQYYKWKRNKTTFESAQLEKLTELLSDKIIMAKDVNHIRNGLTNTQLFCLSLKGALDETITDMENIGTGTGDVFYGLTDNPDPEKFGKVAQLRRIKQDGDIQVSTEGEDVVISYTTPPPPPPPEKPFNFCDVPPLVAKSYDTCDIYLEPGTGNPVTSYYRIGGSKYVGWKAQKVGDSGAAFSPFLIFGQGDGVDKNMINAGRIIKGKKMFVMEMKVDDNKYSGICIYGKTSDANKGKVVIYEEQDWSMIEQAIQYDEPNTQPAGDTNAYLNSGCGV